MQLLYFLQYIQINNYQQPSNLEWSEVPTCRSEYCSSFGCDANIGDLAIKKVPPNVRVLQQNQPWEKGQTNDTTIKIEKLTKPQDSKTQNLSQVRNKRSKKINEVTG